MKLTLCPVHKTHYGIFCTSCVYGGKLVPADPAASVGGLKNDSNKLPVELLSVAAMEGTAGVLAFGAKKYSANNWRKGIAWTRIIGAILRHTFAILRGEDVDPESGLLHVDHLGCEVMFLQDFYRTRPELDDRYKEA